MIAKWESKSGKWFVELESLGAGAYGIKANSSGGVLYADSDKDAIAILQGRVDNGLYQPDANKTPMHRVATEFDKL